MLSSLPNFIYGALLSPSYIAPGGDFGDILSLLALTGLVNRVNPYLWLNASSVGWINGVAVNWPYPQADSTWVPYLEQTKALKFTHAPDAGLCTLLVDPRVKRSVKGIVAYEESNEIDALKWLAVSAAGLYDGVPMTKKGLAKWSCLKDMPVVFTIPSADTFSDDLAAYAWGEYASMIL
jgi:hypothetical protein